MAAQQQPADGGGGGGVLGLGNLLSQVSQGGGSLLERALAIDDALGAWEDKVVEKAQEKAQDIMSLVASDQIGAPTPLDLFCSPPCPGRSHFDNAGRPGRAGPARG